jgi:hypothetical protein
VCAQSVTHLRVDSRMLRPRAVKIEAKDRGQGQSSLCQRVAISPLKLAYRLLPKVGKSPLAALQRSGLDCGRTHDRYILFIVHLREKNNAGISLFDVLPERLWRQLTQESASYNISQPGSAGPWISTRACEVCCSRRETQASALTLIAEETMYG